MDIHRMVCLMQEDAADMPTETQWEDMLKTDMLMSQDMPMNPDTWKMMVILREDAKKEGRAMKENLIIALEASWELDPELMEDVLWDKIDEIGVDSSESVCI